MPNTQASTENPITQAANDYAQLEAAVGKWLLLSDEGLLRVIVAAVLANHLPSDPLWLFVVAPSGGSKTELTSALNKVPGIYPLSDLTTQTLISGKRGVENASLLHRLPKEHAILTLKDFSTVLMMSHDKMHAIMSQLREVYDGSYGKEFGTGESVRWEGKVGLIAGVTNAIDSHQMVFQQLGERFLQYRPKAMDRIRAAERAIDNSKLSKIMRSELQEAFKTYFSCVDFTRRAASVETKKRVAQLADAVSRARSAVGRESRYNREIDHVADPEYPTRLAKQFMALWESIMLTGTTEEAAFNLLTKVGMDCIPHRRRRCIEYLLDVGAAETGDVAKAAKYPPNSTRRVLEDLEVLDVTMRGATGTGHVSKWRLTDDFATTLRLALGKPSAQ